jgi:histone deacetylase 6
MTHMLMSLSHGKIAVCLEVSFNHGVQFFFTDPSEQGGYNFKSISKSALAVTKTLMGEPPERLTKSSPTDAAVNTVRRVRSIQSRYWSRLYPKTSSHAMSGDRLHGMGFENRQQTALTDILDIIRVYQANQLYEACKLTPLFIYRTAISKSFEKQVLAR